MKETISQEAHHSPLEEKEVAVDVLMVKEKDQKAAVIGKKISHTISRAHTILRALLTL